MSVLYKLLYGLGFTPWEQMAGLPVARQIGRFFDREQEGLQAPFGAALDLGCGSGLWSVDLARRGWDVTGIDAVPKALRTARQRAEEAGVPVRFLPGDIAALEDLDLGARFRLLLDFGAVHGMTPSQRQSVARGVNAVAAGQATLLMFAFSPGSRGPLPRGMNRADIEALYTGWKVTDEQPHDLTGTPKLIKKAAPRWYRLRRG